MKQKTLLLTILLTIGITTQYCNWYMCNCDPIEYPFFDIYGIDFYHSFRSSETSSFEEGVWFSHYNGLQLSFDYDVIASKLNNTNCVKPFSLMNQAYGCDCPYDGGQGSKEEKLENLFIITLNDFDSLHLANDTINDLFMVQRSPYGIDLTLDEHLALDTFNIRRPTMDFTLTQHPVINKKFQAKIIVELSTGEIYEAQTKALELKL